MGVGVASKSTGTGNAGVLGGKTLVAVIGGNGKEEEEEEAGEVGGGIPPSHCSAYSRVEPTPPHDPTPLGNCLESE